MCHKNFTIYGLQDGRRSGIFWLYFLPRRNWPVKKKTVLWAIFLMILCVGAGAQSFMKAPYETEPPVKEGYAMPYTLTVYVPDQMVVAYDAKTLKPVRSMICSTGKRAGYTPRGTFTMPATYTSGWDQWGGLYVRYPTRIRGSYYFHSIPYTLKKKVNSSDWKMLGKPASSGCVRLTPLDAQWINYNCKKGTRIRIVDSTIPGLTALHDQIKADLNKNGISSVQPTLKPTPTPPPPNLNTQDDVKAKVIKSFQNKLKARGFYAGAINGKYAQPTIDAWNEYQIARGWEPDSVATTQEQIDLANDLDTVAFKVNMSNGFEGPVVRKIEQRLKELGYFGATPNLKYDGVTVRAAKRFQQDMGLKPANGKLKAAHQVILFSKASDDGGRMNLGMRIGA